MGEQFHPDKNLPGCMMPDGGECCAGYIALVDDWRKQREALKGGETRTVHDPFLGKDVQISNRLVDRLRGKYASGPHLPNGNPEFGWRQFQAPPIQHEAAAVIEALVKALEFIRDGYANQDVNHVDYRVKVYQVALDALEKVGTT